MDSKEHQEEWFGIAVDYADQKTIRCGDLVSFDKDPSKWWEVAYMTQRGTLTLLHVYPQIEFPPILKAFHVSCDFMSKHIIHVREWTNVKSIKPLEKVIKSPWYEDKNGHLQPIRGKELESWTEIMMKTYIESESIDHHPLLEWAYRKVNVFRSKSRKRIKDMILNNFSELREQFNNENDDIYDLYHHIPNDKKVCKLCRTKQVRYFMLGCEACFIKLKKIHSLFEPLELWRRTKRLKFQDGEADDWHMVKSKWLQTFDQ